MTYKDSIKKYIVTHITPDNKHEDDYVVKSMGSFGVWQGFICLLAALTRVIGGWNIINIVYLTPNTEFVCTEFEGGAPEEIKNSTCYDSCTKYGYYNTIFETTLISEFDLICNRAWLASFTQTILMFGLFIGVTLFGWISDRYGRRLSLVLSVAIPVIFSIAAPFASDYWTFSVLRFFVGFGCGGIFTISIVIIIETIGPQYREFGGGMGLVIDGMGQASLVIFAYYSSSWRMFLLSLGLTSILILMSLIFMPETPRWLIANKHSDKAVELMTRIAKFKNLNTDNIKDNVEKAIKHIEERQNHLQTKPSFLDLFQTKELSLITVFSTIIWSVAGACFFGINQYVTLLGSDVNMIVLASGLVQIPAALLGMASNKCFGRKLSSFFFYFLMGVAMGVIPFLPDGHWGIVTLAVIGIFLNTALWTVLVVQVNELFPTALRCQAYGINSGGCKIGAGVAPFIANIHPQWISSAVFSISSVFAAAIGLFLPETKGQALKDIFEKNVS